MSELQKLTLSSAAQAIRNQTIDISQLAELHFSQIEKYNDQIRALRVFDRDKVLKDCELRKEDIKRGRPLGRLHGIFFTAKDSVPVAGYPMSHGTPSSLNPLVSFNSALVQKLLNEGAICVGKTNMAEQGKSYYTDNPLFGRTVNPFNHELSPGGSGGGDSAAIACNYAQFGIGADAGGSIRVPANFCGLFGLFPTRGLFSDAGLGHIVHTFGRLFRSSGILAKSLNDLETLFSVLKGYDKNDPFSVTEDYSQKIFNRHNIKIAVFNSLNGVECDTEITQSLNETKARLSNAGCEIKEFVPPACEKAYEIFIILAGQAALLLEDILAKDAGKTVPAIDEGSIMQNLRSRIAKELPPLSPEMLLKAMYFVDFLRNQITNTFGEFDLLLCPVAATLPPKHGTSIYKVGNQELQSQQAFQFASMVNVLGLPSVAFPTGLSKDKLPLGLQLIGPRFSEQLIFNTIRKAGYLQKIDLS